MGGIDNNLIFEITHFSVAKICSSTIGGNETECWCFVIYISSTCSKTRVIYLQTILTAVSIEVLNVFD